MQKPFGCVWNKSGLICAVIAALLCAGGGVVAQLPAAAVPGAAVSSAGVSSAQGASVETATVVLTYSRQPVDPVQVDQFDIRMDGGKPFHPSRVRVEGDEPLHLAFLIDDSRDPLKAVAEFGNDLAAVTPGQLHPADRVSMYAIDCAVARSMADMPSEAEALKSGVANSLSYAKLHGGSTKPSCSRTLRLWDYAAVAIEALGKLPGRRVLVIVSGGTDRKSTNDWKAVRDLALKNCVAIFGLRDQVLYDADDYVETYSAGTPIGVNGSATSATPRNIGKREPRPFDLLCGNTGGLVINTVPREMPKSLGELMEILRGRYLLEFPRGGFTPDRSHVLKVTVGSKGYFVAAAGAGEPLLKTTSP